MKGRRRQRLRQRRLYLLFFSFLTSNTVYPSIQDSSLCVLRVPRSAMLSSSAMFVGTDSDRVPPQPIMNAQTRALRDP